MNKEYILIKEITFEKARNRIREVHKNNPEFKVIFSSDDDELNRKILEKETIQILLLNQKDRKDSQKQLVKETNREVDTKDIVQALFIKFANHLDVYNAGSLIKCSPGNCFILRRAAATHWPHESSGWENIQP